MVRTNESSLKYLWEQRLFNVEHKKWFTKLMGYDFDIHYKPCLENRVADAHSRVVPASTLMALSIPKTIQLDEVEAQMITDAKLCKIY